MRVVMWLICLAVLPVWGDFAILNKPGKDVEVRSKLVSGKQNIVVFHADTYPVSRRMLSEYSNLGNRRSDLAVLVVDVNQLGSPLAKKYGVTSVPYVQIYDGSGKLLSEGASAYNRTLEMISSGH